jgi:hypothetical protein
MRREDIDELERDDDSRGGLQSDEYRHADPRDLIVEGDVTMAGPGRAPQESGSPEERRAGDSDR